MTSWREAPDFDGFHRDELPRRLAAGAAERAGGRRGWPPPIAFRLPDGRAWTLAGQGGDLAVVPGDGGAAVLVELSLEAWCDLATERRSLFGLLYAGELAFPKGGFDDAARWEPRLRSLFGGRPVYDADTIDLRDSTGAPLDLHAAFSLDDDPAQLTHFLRTTGFLRLRGVLGPDEIDALRAEVERLADLATPGDKRSWWAKDEHGDEVLCRITYMNERSPLVATLPDDLRLRRIAALSGEQLVPAPDRMDGVGVVIKVPGAREGLADLPWHVDCGLGGHPVLCPTIQIGIQLDAASAATGQLHFLAGSWSACTPQLTGSEAAGLPVVAIDTEPGDCTVHFSDTLHAAPPPTGAGTGRRAVYVSYHSPVTLEAIGPGQAYNDVLLAREDGYVPSPDEVLA